MIVETSALIALVKGEPGWVEFRDAIAADPAPKLSAANYLEAGIVFDRHRALDPRLPRDVDRLIEALGIGVVPVTAGQARTARQAYRDYGRGSGHRARLNFGDCFGYALAIETDEPLLFTGDDFSHTDVRRVAAGG